MGGYSEQCSHCGKWFLNPRGLHNHIDSKHSYKAALTTKPIVKKINLTNTPKV